MNWRNWRENLGQVLRLAPYYLMGRAFAAHLPRPVSVPTTHADPLTAYFDQHTTGPGIWKWRHYFPIYHQHLSRFVGTEVHILEIGIYSGGSLPMWHAYFGPRCHVYGVDIEGACRAYATDRTTVLIGDQADPAFWATARSQVPRIDIVIDDGGHTPRQQRITLEALLPHISPGGVYICEDIHGRVNPFPSYIAGLIAELHTSVDAGEGRSTPTAAQAVIAGIHAYPFMTVIETHQTPLHALTSERHGTQWQPFDLR